MWVSPSGRHVLVTQPPVPVGDGVATSAADDGAWGGVAALAADQPPVWGSTHLGAAIDASDRISSVTPSDRRWALLNWFDFGPGPAGGAGSSGRSGGAPAGGVRAASTPVLLEDTLGGRASARQRVAVGAA